jgi:uncharacterized protein (DUF58 family)
MRPTPRGIGAAFAAVALLGASAFFGDILVEVTLFCLLIVIASEAAWVGLATRRPEARLRLTKEAPARVKKRLLYPDDELVERVRLEKVIGGRVAFESKVPFTEVVPKVVGGARLSTLELRFRTPYAGEYSGREIGVEATGPLGLFSSKGVIPFAVKYTVRPRLLSVAATTVRLLGNDVVGQSPVEAPGVGSEFYEMRGYQAGDDFRRVNWKASARQGELMVNEHKREVGGSYLLVLDARAPGFRDADRLASVFLSFANVLAASGVSFGILVHDGSKVTAISPEFAARASLSVALMAALSATRLDSEPEFLELVPVRAPLKPPLESGGGKEPALAQLPRLRRTQFESTVKEAGPWANILRYIIDSPAGSVVYVSGLFNEPGTLMELAWQARHYRNVDFSVANPCEPWASAETEEEGRRLHSRYQKLVSELAAGGIKLYRGEPLNLVHRVLFA